MGGGPLTIDIFGMRSHSLATKKASFWRWKHCNEKGIILDVETLHGNHYSIIRSCLLNFFLREQCLTLDCYQDLLTVLYTEIY